MSASDNNREILEKTEFVGEVSFKGTTAPITFHAWACSDCHMKIKADVVDGITFFMVIWSYGKAIFTLTKQRYLAKVAPLFGSDCNVRGRTRQPSLSG